MFINYRGGKEVEPFGILVSIFRMRKSQLKSRKKNINTSSDESEMSSKKLTSNRVQFVLALKPTYLSSAGQAM